MWRSRSDGQTSLCVCVVAILLLVGGGLLAAGCDGGGSKRDSTYQRLVGTWTPERLLVDGADVTGQIEQRYESVWLEFRPGEGGRSYRLRGIREEDTLRVEGPVAVLRADVLSMEGGFGHPVTWTFAFGELSNSVELRLPATQTAGSEAFLSTLLPGRGWGRVQRVQLDLLYEEGPPEDE